MRLEELTADALPLYEALYTDPRVMAELGGAQPVEAAPRRLEAGLRVMREGTGLVLTVRDTDSSGAETPAGIVCYFPGEVDGTDAHEIGWMILPEFQGRGLATRATKAIIERARRNESVTALHAMTAASNTASNAICRRLGFAFVGERPMTYDGRTWPGHLWRLDLGAGSPPDDPSR